MRFAFSRSVHAVPVTESQPVQLANVWPVAGLAVKPIEVPRLNAALQVVGQVIPEGPLLTVPANAAAAPVVTPLLALALLAALLPPLGPLLAELNGSPRSFDTGAILLHRELSVADLDANLVFLLLQAHLRLAIFQLRTNLVGLGRAVPDWDREL